MTKLAEYLGKLIRARGGYTSSVNDNWLEIKAKEVEEIVKGELLKDAQSDDLPEIDREVIVLCQDYEDSPSYLRVSYGHRPNPDGWDGKSFTSDEITHYEPMLYDKGGWNQPNVKWWLDLDLPKAKEDDNSNNQ